MRSFRLCQWGMPSGCNFLFIYIFLLRSQWLRLAEILFNPRNPHGCLQERQQCSPRLTPSTTNMSLMLMLCSHGRLAPTANFSPTNTKGKTPPNHYLTCMWVIQLCNKTTWSLMVLPCWETILGIHVLLQGLFVLGSTFSTPCSLKFFKL